MKSHCLAALASEVAALLEQPDKQDPKTRLCSSGDLIKLRRHGAPIHVVGSGVTQKAQAPRAGASPAIRRESRESHWLAALASEVAALLEQPDKPDPRLACVQAAIWLRRHSAPIRTEGREVAVSHRKRELAGAIPASLREPPRSNLIRNPSPPTRKTERKPHTRAHMENGVRWRTRRNEKSSKGKSTTPGQKKTD